MTTESVGWTISEGEVIARTLVHARYGGASQGGIRPSRKSPNVLVFTDPVVGAQYGYYDRWDEGVLHYTGEGQKGDQRMIVGNKAILNLVPI